MTVVSGTYFNGQISLDSIPLTTKPVKVTVSFDEEPVKKLEVSDFSFLECQDLMKDYKGSFSDEVINERRNSL